MPQRFAAPERFAFDWRQCVRRVSKQTVLNVFLVVTVRHAPTLAFFDPNWRRRKRPNGIDDRQMQRIIRAVDFKGLFARWKFPEVALHHIIQAEAISGRGLNCLRRFAAR